MDKPNPGSNEALEQGCKCPVIDNGYGRLAPYYDEEEEPRWWITGGCPIHDESD